MNELTKLIEYSDIRGIQLFPDIKEIFLLLFADDIALISDNKRFLKSVEYFRKFLQIISYDCKCC